MKSCINLFILHFFSFLSERSPTSLPKRIMKSMSNPKAWLNWVSVKRDLMSFQKRPVNTRIKALLNCVSVKRDLMSLQKRPVNTRIKALLNWVSVKRDLISLQKRPVNTRIKALLNWVSVKRDLISLQKRPTNTLPTQAKTIRSNLLAWMIRTALSAEKFTTSQ